MTDGLLRTEGERRGVRFERRYDATPEELWAALTEPEQLRGWLGEARVLDARVGGAVHLRLGESDEQAVSGTVLACEPPRLLEYEWRWPGEDESVLRVELRTEGEGTLLVLDHRLLPAHAATGYAAGWHAYLDLLELHLQGTSGEWEERFAELLPAYRAELIVRMGGCLCGAVRYSVRGEPVHVGCCHCADCRKESGSAFTVYAQWPRDAFELSGDVATYEGRSFCPRCGSRLICLDGTGVEIRIGSLDDAPFGLQPQAEIWIRRREAWLPPVEGASQHRENR